MYKFYCPKCNTQVENVDFDNTAQAVELPDPKSSKQKGYALHFLCCKACNTVVSTVAVPMEPWTKQ
jgi:uncharacterized protein with PIN domain